MTTHPDILELELHRSGEASAQTQAHLAECPACQARLESLGTLESELARGVPEIEIPESVHLAVAGAIEGALARTQESTAGDSVAEPEAVPEAEPEAQVIRPAFWRRAVPAIGALSAAAMVMLTFVSFAGDNIRSLFGASADALAGNEDRSVNTNESGTALEGHKNLADFSESNEYVEGAVGEAPSAGEGYARPEQHKSLMDFGQSEARGFELVWTPPEAFSGTLTLEVALPPGARLTRVASARAADRVEDRASSGSNDPTRRSILLSRAVESRELVTLQLSLAGGEKTPPRILSATLTHADGTVQAITLELRLR